MRKLLLAVAVLAFMPFACNCDDAPPKSPPPHVEAEAPERYPFLLYVKIPAAIAPLQRAEKYGDPLNEMLLNAKLGEVSGGGTMLTKDGQIEYVGVDIEVFDPEKALPSIIAKLKELGVPKGTVIEQYEPQKVEHSVY